jgi:hypothetical protein
MTHVVRTTLVVKQIEEGHVQIVLYLVYFIDELMGSSKIRCPTSMWSFTLLQYPYSITIWMSH